MVMKLETFLFKIPHWSDENYGTLCLPQVVTWN